MRGTIRALFLLPLLLACAATQAQQPWSIGTRVYGGFLAPHHESLWIMVDRHASALELFVQRPFSSAREWHHDYGEPRWGVSALWLDAGSSSLGNVFRVLPYLELPLSKPGGWELDTRIGWGLGVVQRPFDRVENFKQHAIGSKFDLAAQFAFSLRRAIGPDVFSAAFSIDHLSNGAMRQPNLGINVLMVSLGYSHRFGEVAVKPIDADTLHRGPKRITTYVMGNIGWNEVYPLNSGRRSVFALSASGYRRIGRKSAIGAGVDLFNKGSLAIADTALADDPRIALTQGGAHLGYALLFGDMALYFEAGMYIVTPYKEREEVYTRVGMRQRISSRLFANFSLKSHLFVADHFELGLGYFFR